MTFTLFDILIIIITSVSSLLGIYRGMINITMNLLGFIASIFVAIVLTPYVNILFSSYIKNELASTILSGISAYIVSLVFFTLLVSKTLPLFACVSKGVIDRLSGLVIGAVRGVLISLFIFAVLAVFTSGTYMGAKKAEDLVYNLSSKEYPDWLKDSVTAPYLEVLSKKVVSLMPHTMLDSIKMPSNLEEDVVNSINKHKEGDIKNLKESVLGKEGSKDK